MTENMLNGENSYTIDNKLIKNLSYCKVDAQNFWIFGIYH